MKNSHLSICFYATEAALFLWLFSLLVYLQDHCSYQNVLLLPITMKHWHELHVPSFHPVKCISGAIHILSDKSQLMNRKTTCSSSGIDTNIECRCTTSIFCRDKHPQSFLPNRCGKK
ncbi:unnamed protein product [Ixodes pacificus]